MEKCYLIIDKIDKNKISDSISLSYEERFLRRKKLTSDNGLEFLVNLAETKSLSQNQAFKLDNDEPPSSVYISSKLSLILSPPSRMVSPVPSHSVSKEAAKL